MSYLFRFLYTDKIDITLDNVMFVMYACKFNFSQLSTLILICSARKYAIYSLQNASIKYLKENLCAENALVILKEAKFFDLEELFDASMQIINQDATQILQSDRFLEIDRETLGAILQNDRLRIKENVIFESVMVFSMLKKEIIH